MLRVQFAEERVLLALRVGDKDDGQARSLIYRIVLNDDLDQPPELEITMDYAGWLSDFWRHPSRTTFLGGADGELYVVDPSSFQEFYPQDRGVTQIYGRALDDVFAVTISGMILHWNGSDWLSVGPTNETALFAVGELKDKRIVAVGEKGTILVQTRESWLRLEAPTNVRLTAVGQMSAATYIGGEHGICLRLDDDLSLEPVPGPSFGTYGFADYRGRGLSASQADGLMQIVDGELVPYAQPLQPYGVAVQGDLLAIYGDDNLAVFDGQNWRSINLDAI
jgi:hypothetical protein